MKNFLIIVVVLVVVAGGAFYFYQKSNPSAPVLDVKNVINSANFNCAAGKSIQAAFFKDQVALSLSDGRKILLPQAISASGARYANADESFVFWNKGDTAFVDEVSTTTFADCVVVGNINVQATSTPVSRSTSTQNVNSATMSCPPGQKPYYTNCACGYGCFSEEPRIDCTNICPSDF